MEFLYSIIVMMVLLGLIMLAIREREKIMSFMRLDECCKRDIEGEIVKCKRRLEDEVRRMEELEKIKGLKEGEGK